MARRRKKVPASGSTGGAETVAEPLAGTEDQAACVSKRRSPTRRAPERGDPDRDEPDRDEPEPDWRELFVGRTAIELLPILIAGDPLGLRKRVARRLRVRAWLLAADRVLLRAVARCARAAPDYRGASEIADWLDLLIDDAVLDLLREDSDAEYAGRAPDEIELEAYVALAAPLGLEPLHMRRVCIAFNRLDEPERVAFHAWVLAGRKLSEAARSLRLTESVVADRARCALDAVLAAAEGPEHLEGDFA